MEERTDKRITHYKKVNLRSAKRLTAVNRGREGERGGRGRERTE